MGESDPSTCSSKAVLEWMYPAELPERLTPATWWLFYAGMNGCSTRGWLEQTRNRSSDLVAKPQLETRILVGGMIAAL